MLAAAGIVLAGFVTAIVPAVAAPGDLDGTFGSNGTLALSPPAGTREVVGDLAIQPDGKLIVAGEQFLSQGSFRDVLIVRLLGDGSLDPSFGSGGRVVTDLGTTVPCHCPPPAPLASASDDRIYAVALQPDGRIVVGGGSGVLDTSGFVLVRYLSDGRLDESFGNAGFVLTDMRQDEADRVTSLHIRADGTILAGGLSGSSFAMARYLPNGALDSGFGTGGRLVTSSGIAQGAMAIQPDGRVVVAGSSQGRAHADFRVARYLANGAPDLGFGAGGMVTTDVAGRPETAYGAAVQPDGRIVVAGTAVDPGPISVLARYQPDGTLDSQFGSGGRVVGGSDTDEVWRVAVQPDGKVVVAGDRSAGGGTRDTAVARYLADGSVDSSFGEGGARATDLANGGDDLAIALAMQPDGRFVVASTVATEFLAGPERVGLARYLGSFAGPGRSSGYWMVAADGRVYPFGDANNYGGPARYLAGSPAIDLEPTPSGRGYWVIDDRGRVYGFGDAAHYGNVDLTRLADDERITSISGIPSGRGYWIFTSKGRAITFGEARWHQDMSGTALNGPVLDSIPTPSGNGYYMVASDGGIFAFGDAQFYGSMGGKPLNKPVQSLVPDSDGAGYWLVASDGGVFAFESSFRGSMGGAPLNKPVTGMVPFGNGYLMVGEDGGIFNFSDRSFYGSLGSNPPMSPITSVAALELD